LKTGLWRFFSGDAGEGYVASQRIGDEWHLHRLTVAAVTRMAATYLRVAKVAGVPSRLFPLRYVIAFRPV